MLRIVAGNRIESLLEQLLEALEQPPASPFVAEQVIVPSAAVGRALALAIAGRQGVCAHVDFAFLAQWLWRQIGALVPGVADQSPFAPPVLGWRVLALFDEGDGPRAAVPAGSRLAAYLRDADPVMRFELALRVAALLEQYITFRPEWLAAWLDDRSIAAGAREAAPGERHVAADEAWQAALWRRIAVDLDLRRRDPIAVFLAELERLRAAPAAAGRSALPARAHVFCLPSMAPLHIRMLDRLATVIDLRIYVLNPCRQYWFEIVDPRRLSWLAAHRRADYHEIGNRLLANWGKQTQAHLDLLLTETTEAVVDEAAFAPRDREHLLARIQDAILDLDGLEPGSVALAAGDRSIEVHVCHSLTRELEVLHDQLLAAFACAAAPAPSDVLVVVPDLDAAAPLIDAVFGTVPAARHIAYAISGRAATASSAPARMLLELLALVASRFAASAVFDLLQQPLVARRFELDAEALPAIQRWLRDAAIRWDIDGGRHRELQLPPLDRFDFTDGLERLFLGYALPDVADAPWQGRLPAGRIEGSDALALGGFARFVAALAQARRQAASAALPAAWVARLLELVDAFFDAGDDAADAQGLLAVRAAIRELGRNLAAAGFDGRLPLDVVRGALQSILDESARGAVATGAVTFASMGSLRGLPFRIVCAIGLDEGAFPSSGPAAEFDLIAHRPRRGDRQRRTDERNLFLDLLLAARDRFYLSYSGRSVRDNASLPPSVLVSELLDVLVPAIAAADVAPHALAAARERLVVMHPLQAFSIAQFGVDRDPRVASYNAEYCEAQRSRLALSPAAAGDATGDPGPDAPADGEDDRGEVDGGENGDGDHDDAFDPVTLEAPRRQRAFFAAPLLPPPQRDVPLEALVRFFFNPSRELLRERLGIAIGRGAEPLPDEEPFWPEFTAAGALAARLLPACREGRDLGELIALARAGTEYPVGALGDLALRREVEAVRRFAAAIAGATDVAGDDDPRSSLPAARGELRIDIDGEAWRLTGTLDGLRRDGLLLHQYRAWREGERLAAWIRHLFLCHLRPAGVAPRTLWLGRDCAWRLHACDDATSRLGTLLRLYRDGMTRPLRFFLKASWAYVDRGANLAAARRAWHSGPGNPWGEDRDAAHRLALRGVDAPLDREFEATAEAVFGGLRDHIEPAEPAVANP